MSDDLAPKLVVFFLILAISIEHTESEINIRIVSPSDVITVKNNHIAYPCIDIEAKAIEVVLTYPFQQITSLYISTEIEAIQLG